MAKHNNRFEIERTCDKCGPLKKITTDNTGRGTRVGATWTARHRDGKCKGKGEMTLTIVRVFNPRLDW